MNNLWTWVGGRQGTGYEKFLLCQVSWPIKLDMYILRMGEGTHLPEHTDANRDGDHHRLNIILKRADSGGDFILNGEVKRSRINYFRPDILPHSVTKVSSGTRYVLSLGWLKEVKNEKLT